MSRKSEEPDRSPQKHIKGVHVPLLSESEKIEPLGLSDRPNPRGALRWVVRMKRIKAVRHGRGLLAFSLDEVNRYISGLIDRAR